MAPGLTLSQEEFFILCRQNADIRFERTAQGDLVIVPPAGLDGSASNAWVTMQLCAWVARTGLGRALDSSAGFELPNGATLSPDCSWITAEQLAGLSPEQRRRFPRLCPFFVVELLSPSDSLKATKEKLQEFIDNGTRLGWLIDPERKQVHIYRPGQPAEVLEGPMTVTGDPELPGFLLELEKIWQP
jgi:Uma2 family endonuclease